jgi:hypothetical protein
MYNQSELENVSRLLAQLRPPLSRRTAYEKIAK